LLTKFTLILSIGLVFSGLGFAAPTTDGESSPANIFAREDPDPYPVKAACTALCKTEPNKSLFYAGIGYGVTKAQVADFQKREPKKHLVGDLYTYNRLGFTSRRNTKGHTTERYQRFADDFSEVFAEKSSGEVFVLLNWDSATDPCTVWERKEFPALKANAAVTKVTHVNPNDFSQTRQIWPVPARKSPRDETQVLEKRVDKCLDDTTEGPPPGDNTGPYIPDPHIPFPPAPRPTVIPLPGPTKQPDPPAIEDTCDVSYKFVFDAFEVRGKNWPEAKLGKNGEGLLKELKGCGKVTDFGFDQTPKDPQYQWYAHGHLPIGTKACVGRAVKSAGGPSAGNCHGAG